MGTSKNFRFTCELMQQIREKLQKGESKRSIAKDLGVAESSRKRLKSNTIPTSLGRFRPTFFLRKTQAALANHIKNMNKMFYGITLKELQCIAYQFVEQAKIQHSFNTEKSCRKKWLKNFCEQHNIVVRTPEKTSLAKTIGFNTPR